MNSIIIIGIAAAVAIASVSITFLALTAENNPPNEYEFPFEITPYTLAQGGEGQKNLLPADSTLFNMYFYDSDFEGLDPQGRVMTKDKFFELKPENSDIYREIRNEPGSQNALVIFPLFTLTAYAENGFYHFYAGQCDESCINDVSIRHDITSTYQSSDNAIKILKLLDYPMITDVEVDKYPEILNEFDKIILLHNEYVTKTMFDAITQHPKVVYLYPNALYAEITVDYEKDAITLIRGHGHPDPDLRNGFDWEFDNTHPYEFDSVCANWEFYDIDNGIMLNCYPENIIHQSAEMLKSIKEY